jgi:hypothetical protein
LQEIEVFFLLLQVKHQVLFVMLHKQTLVLNLRDKEHEGSKREMEKEEESAPYSFHQFQ